jgi:hypothetical protein
MKRQHLVGKKMYLAFKSLYKMKKSHRKLQKEQRQEARLKEKHIHFPKIMKLTLKSQ